MNALMRMQYAVEIFRGRRRSRGPKSVTLCQVWLRLITLGGSKYTCHKF